MSASRMIFSGSGVREWTTVTVASAFSSNSETGNPTMLLRPTTTALFPLTVIPLRDKSSRHPYRENINFRLIWKLAIIYIHSNSALPWGCKVRREDLYPSLQACQCSMDESHQRPYQDWFHSKLSPHLYVLVMEAGLEYLSNKPKCILN